jgi:tetrahydromethanopterin S-methyltransferase subunit E
MLGVARAQGFDIHFGVLMLRKDQVLIADVHSSLWGKFKRRAENSVKNGLDAAGFASPSYG